MSSDSKKMKLISDDEWEIEAVLSDNLSDDAVTFSDVVAAVVRDKTAISGVLARAGRAHPLPSRLQHLKRVRRNPDSGVFHILLFLVQDVELDHVADDGFPETEVLRVPLGPVLTRTQFEQCNRLWPSKFHEDQQLETILSKKSKEIWGTEHRDGHHQFEISYTFAHFPKIDKLGFS
jgi:hypothetical protein